VDQKSHFILNDVSPRGPKQNNSFFKIKNVSQKYFLFVSGVSIKSSFPYAFYDTVSAILVFKSKSSGLQKKYEPPPSPRVLWDAWGGGGFLSQAVRMVTVLKP
jgi:hypothetical protein